MSRKDSPAESKAQPPRISVARNPKAAHDFHILDTFEAGLVLTGTEVKSLRRKGASIKEGFARLSRGEVFLEGMHITPYEQGNRYNHEPRRPRKLLVHRRELEKFIGAVQRQGMTIVPLKLYFNPQGRAKIEIALAKGKNKGDKRATIKEREWQRDKARLMRARG